MKLTKILYVNSNEPDYLSDCLFHGFYKILGKNFTYLNDHPLMYKDEGNLEKLKNFHVVIH